MLEMFRVRQTTFAKLRQLGTQQVAVAELEALGLDVRIINLLERHLGVLWLEELLQYTPDELREWVPNLGQQGIDDILACLGRFDEIEEARETLSKRFECEIPLS